MIMNSCYVHQITMEEEQLLKLLNKSKCSLCDFLDEDRGECEYFMSSKQCLPRTYRKKTQEE